MYWGTGPTKGTRTWSFHLPIDSRNIVVGADIAIIRDPLHQNTLDPPSGLFSDHNIQSRPALLEGKVVGIRRVEEGVVTFTITDEIRGGYTEVRVPAAHTAISPDGGWYTKAIPIWKQGGLILRYPMWVEAHDLKKPVPKRRELRADYPTLASDAY